MKSFCIFVKKIINVFGIQSISGNHVDRNWNERYFIQLPIWISKHQNKITSNLRSKSELRFFFYKVFMIRYPYWHCNSMLVTKLLNHIESTIIENTDVLLGRKYIINIYMVFAHAKKSKNKKENRFEMRIIFIILICILLLFFSNKYILSKYRKRKIVQNKYLLPCNYFASMFT